MGQALEELPLIEKGKHGGVVFRPFVSPEVRREVTMELGRKARPELADHLDDLREVRGVYESVFNALRREVETSAPGSLEPKLTVS